MSFIEINQLHKFCLISEARDVAFPSLYMYNFIPQNLVVQHWSMLVPMVFLLLMVV